MNKEKLPSYLVSFNDALLQFQEKYPTKEWSESFRLSLINDYSFFSARVEDTKLQYGDTIRFLNNETIRGINFGSLLGISNHQSVLKAILDNLNDFKLSESFIKQTHRDLMDNSLAWETEFKPELIGKYRNIPTVGSREPFFENKEYTSHFNLEIVMSSYINLFNNQFSDIDNRNPNKHLLTRIAFFHNNFLNKIHPFADGNGRVCRIIIGALLMANNCPPIFPEIKTQEEQIEYISTIVQCENNKMDDLMIEYFAKGMTSYLLKRIEN